VGGKALFARHAAAIRYVEVESAGVHIDVDTPDTLQGHAIEGDSEPPT
jgi:CTP:molybdopterin cytidylyltransferase MocA